MKKSINKTFMLQTELGNYCRTGLDEPKTTIQELTFQYRRLVFNVIEDTLTMAFPLTQELIGKKRWKKMVDFFFKNHKCETPQVWKLPKEFTDFYNGNLFPFKKQFDELSTLLQYEWIETEVFMMEDEPIQYFEKERKNLDDLLVPNPEIRILPILYPYHLKKISEISKEDKGQYFVSIHRDFYSKRIHFLDLSYPYVESLIKINAEKVSSNDLYQILAKFHDDADKVKEYAEEFIAFSLDKNIILGFQNSK
ncbi:HvfC/BufC N-terminal domain-containing protein [Chryseobacterium terrae]|uniref:DNA-binding domain-containing protein n=1 Tax=Chryseobacterium terrae TaxID=3163299 RepID=A0ABW8Y0A0_9FLAO